jgi:putative oxidoreductase
MPVARRSFTVRDETSPIGCHQTAMNMLNRPSQALILTSWAFQLLAAVILLQTLFFKFTAAEESVYIFTKLGMEPVGRIGSGIVELIASALLLVPATVPLGAILAMGVMAGAIFSHLTVLGIEVKGDGGLLFGLAITVLVSCAVVLLIRRSEIPFLGRYFEVA